MSHITTLSTTPEAIRKRKSRAKLKASDMDCREYVAKPEHHKLLKALLAELQA